MADIKSTLRIGIYGDIDLNLVDGSAIWLRSIALMLGKIDNVEPVVLLKKNIAADRDPLPKEIKTLTAGDFKLKVITSKEICSVLNSVQSSEEPLDYLVVRGFQSFMNICREGIMAGRLIPYLTDILDEQSPSGLDGKKLSESLPYLDQIKFMLAQTEEFRAGLEFELAEADAGRLNQIACQLC